jgi:hypothetical protein
MLYHVAIFNGQPVDFRIVDFHLAAFFATEMIRTRTMKIIPVTTHYPITIRERNYPFEFFNLATVITGKY